jgi:hypothetical protein
LKPIWQVVGLVQPLTDAWFLHIVHSWEQQILRSSARSTAHVFPLGYARLNKICVRAFSQLGVGPSHFSVQGRHLIPAHCLLHSSKVRYLQVTTIAQMSC